MVSKKQEKKRMAQQQGNRLGFPNWLLALLLVFSLSILGLGINLLAGSPIPFWLLLGFSVVYSTEKWFGYITRKHKKLGKLYRLLLNLSILSILGLLIWSGIKLFSGSFLHNPIMGSLIFLAEFVFFIWIWRVIAKNSWRRPSMKLTVSLLLGISLVFTFAGVHPLSTYKDNLSAKWSNLFIEQDTRQAEKATEKEAEQATEEATRDEEEAYSQEPLPVRYIPILRNPSWGELKAFLWEDKTDQLEYVFPTFVCADFAKALQANAKAAGLRCALAEVRLEGYPDWYNYGIPPNTGHGLNAFETTDRGLVYIDCTSSPSFRGNADKLIVMEIGKEYTPKRIFPTSGWGEWISMGTIKGVRIIDWND